MVVSLPFRTRRTPSTTPRAEREVEEAVKVVEVVADVHAPPPAADTADTPGQALPAREVSADTSVSTR